MPDSNALWVALATLAALVVGTVLRLVALWGVRGEAGRERIGSLVSWWILAVLFLGAAVLGRTATAVFFTLLCGVALGEFARLPPGAPPERGLHVAFALLVPLNYLWIWLGWTGLFGVFLPLAALLLPSCLLLMSGRAVGGMQHLARMIWGTLLLVYCPAHAVLLLTLPYQGNPVAGGVGWLLFLVILVESNDILQALVGRAWGRHRVAPRISPGKSWEGLFGGLLGTVLLAVLLGRWLTPWEAPQAAVAGLLIAGAGFLGDLNMSAVKREAGVKDSGQLLPGQGGMLDRIDSLTFAAPALYYFVALSESTTRTIPLHGGAGF